MPNPSTTGGTGRFTVSPVQRRAMKISMADDEMRRGPERRRHQNAGLQPGAHHVPAERRLRAAGKENRQQPNHQPPRQTALPDKHGEGDEKHQRHQPAPIAVPEHRPEQRLELSPASTGCAWNCAVCWYRANRCVQAACVQRGNEAGDRLPALDRESRPDGAHMPAARDHAKHHEGQQQQPVADRLVPGRLHRIAPRSRCSSSRQAVSSSTASI